MGEDGCFVAEKNTKEDAIIMSIGGGVGDGDGGIVKSIRLFRRFSC